MKRIFTILFAIGITTSALGQFKLSGKISNTTKVDTLYINIPYVYGYYYHDNDVPVPIDAKGNFNIIIKLPQQQKFGIMRLNHKAATLLFTRGKSLVLNYNPADTSIAFSGTAAPENEMLNKVNLNSVPFFAHESNYNAYAKLSLPELEQQVIKPWTVIRDKNIAMVQESTLSPGDKKLIIQEVKANYILQMNYFARGIMDRSDKKKINDFILVAYKDATLTPDVLPAGPTYYNFIDSYIGYQETQIFSAMSPEQAKDPQTLLPRYNITLDSGKRVGLLKGKSFVQWILVRNTYPKNIAEGWLAQNILGQCLNKDLAYAQPLMQEMRTHYPQSGYIPYLQAKIDTLSVLLARNLKNKDIKIAEGYEKMTSIYQAISKLKGKVVYLDVWGTWCGPCKEELRYNPELKQYFKDKDVAFVYLDMDDDIKNSQWRDFIKVNGMTGLHLRKNRTEIQEFWAELLPKGDTEQYYPMYFIFDKEGKLVQHHAKRPSDKTELYKQISQYL
jgi:thiol-disulfide isomerase/thioredoxin